MSEVNETEIRQRHRVVPQPLGTRIEKYKRKMLVGEEKAFKVLYDNYRSGVDHGGARSTTNKLPADELPLYKRLLQADYYAKLDEHTVGLPRQEMNIQQRKITRKTIGQNSNIVQYESAQDEAFPLYAFMSSAAKTSKKEVQRKVQDAAKEHTQLNRRLGKKYLHKHLRRTLRLNTTIPSAVDSSHSKAGGSKGSANSDSDGDDSDSGSDSKDNDSDDGESESGSSESSVVDEVH